MSTNDLFSTCLVEDISAGCATWVPDIKRMLAHPFADDSGLGWDESANRLQLPEADYQEKLNTLRYILLVDRLALDEIRCGALESERNRRQPPEHSAKEHVEGRGNECRDTAQCPVHIYHIIVDLAGCYVPSLAGFFSALRKPWAGRIRDLIDQHGDGPAVILCPEAIVSFYDGFLTTLKERLSAKPAPSDNPVEFFVRATLLHELGHHVFPVSQSGRYEYLSEGLAHLYTAVHLASNERLWLYAKSELQPTSYSTWRVLWAMLRPDRRTWRARQALRAWFRGQVPEWSCDILRLEGEDETFRHDHCTAIFDNRFWGSAWVLGEELDNRDWLMNRYSCIDMMLNRRVGMDWRAGAPDLDIAWPVLHIDNPPGPEDDHETRHRATMHAIKMMPQRTESNAIALYLKHLKLQELVDARLVRSLIPMIADDDKHLYFVQDHEDYYFEPSWISGASCSIEVRRYLEVLDTETDLARRQRIAVSLGYLGLNDPKVVYELINALKADRDYMRKCAAIALGRIGCQNSMLIQPLLTIALEDNSIYRRNYVLALASVVRDDVASTEEVKSELLTALQDNVSEERRQHAAEALGNLGICEDRICEPLLNISLHDASRYVRIAAVSALIKLGGGGEKGMKRLIAAFHADPNTHADVFWVTSQAWPSDSRVSDMFVEMLASNSEEKMRLAAVKAMYYLVDPSERVMDQLVSALRNDPFRDVRCEAAKVLGHFGHPVEHILAALREAQQKGDLYQYAAEALDRLGDPYIQLQKLQTASDASDIRWAVEKLGSKGQSSDIIIEALQERLDDPDGEVRAEASSIIGRFCNTPNLRVVGELSRAVQDYKGSLRRRALFALECLGVDLA